MSKRIVSWLGTVLLSGTLVACSPGIGSGESLVPGGVVSSDSAPGSTTLQEVEAEILDVYFGYWAARVEAQRGNVTPDVFGGHVMPIRLEEDLQEARMYAEWGVQREGEPGISETTVEIDGDRAVVMSCIDYNTWVIPEADHPETMEIARTRIELLLIDGRWMINDWLTIPESERFC